MIMEVGQSKIHSVGWELGSAGELMVQIKSRVKKNSHKDPKNILTLKSQAENLCSSLKLCGWEWTQRYQSPNHYNFDNYDNNEIIELLLSVIPIFWFIWLSNLYSQALSSLQIQFKDIALLQSDSNMKLVFLGAPSVVHDTLNEGDFSC